MRLVPTHPRALASFAYNLANRTPGACHANGDVTLCGDVPATLFQILRKVTAPEKVFLAGIALHFPCEIASARLGRLAPR